MEFTTKKNALARRRCLFEGTVEQPIDSDITLPEYFPDVVRVLKCTLTPRITTVQCAADRVSADGSALLRVLYLCEENGVRCFEQTIPFSKYVECTADGNGCAGAQAKTEYVNCRVVSQRKMDIHGSISIGFHVFCKEQCGMLSDCTGGGIQMKKKSVTASTLAGCTEKIFTLGETLELSSAKPSIAQLVRSEAVALLEDVKIVPGKVLIKGELQIHTLYIPDGEEPVLQQMEHAMPISQIMEIEGAQEDCVADAALSVCAVEVVAKTDASGALRLLDANVSVCAQLSLYEACETEVILDAYSTQYEMQMQKQNVALSRVCDRFTDTCLCRGTLDTAGSNLMQVLDMTCQNLTYNTVLADGEIKINGTLGVGILFIDRENNWGFLERSFDFSYSRAIVSAGGQLSCAPHIVVTGKSFTLNAEDKVDARIELDISALVFSEETLQVAADISMDTEHKKNKKTAALTIYFSQEGESVWEIARRYNTTAEAIMTENALSGDLVEEKRKLLIPRV